MNKFKKYIPKCLKLNAPCKKHSTGKYLNCSCGEAYLKIPRKPITDETRLKMSLACIGKTAWNKGIPMKEESKQKCRDKNKGRRLNPSGEFKKGIVVWNKGLPKEDHPCYGKKQSKEHIEKRVISNQGKPVSDETRLKQSNTRKNNFIGKHGWNWIEDRTKVVGRHNRSFHDSDMKRWRIEVYKRDNYKCSLLNNIATTCSGRIEAHHILSWKDYPECRYDIKNGITLCHAHHPRKRAEERALVPVFQELVASKALLSL